MRLLLKQADLLRNGTLAAQPLMPIQWLFDLFATGHPPCSLWDLPAEIADEIRMVHGIARPKDMAR